METNRICNSLKTRGYPDAILTRAKHITEQKQHNDLLSISQDTQPLDSRPILVLDYNNQFSDIKNIIGKYIPLSSEEDYYYY